MNINTKNKIKSSIIFSALLLVLPILLVTQANASSFLKGFELSTGSSSHIYSMETLQSELASDRVSCFSMKRRVFISKGYKSKYGNNKGFCTAKRAKIEGINRLTKDNLNSDAFRKASKALGK